MQLLVNFVIVTRMNLLLKLTQNVIKNAGNGSCNVYILMKLNDRWFHLKRSTAAAHESFLCYMLIRYSVSKTMQELREPLGFSCGTSRHSHSGRNFCLARSVSKLVLISRAYSKHYLRLHNSKENVRLLNWNPFKILYQVHFPSTVNHFF